MKNKISRLRITKETQNDFSHVIECERLIVEYGVKLLSLVKAGYICLLEGATLTAPVLKQSDGIYLWEGAKRKS